MRLAIVGTGYVGLVSGACLADFGHDVTCIDIDKKKVVELDKGILPIFEPGLDDLIKKNISAGRLKFISNLKNVIDTFDVIFLTVGTPSRSADGHADLSSLFSVISEIRDNCSSAKTIVLKSTVPVGTNTKIHELLSKGSKAGYFDVVSNPEFLREGSAIVDFMKPDRIIIGARTQKAKKVMTEIYKPLYLREFPIVFTDQESAELIKYASNTFLATKVTFINEIAALCEHAGGDVREVAKGMGLDNRIGKHFLHAGPGYGGSCFPKDTLALSEMGKEHGANQTIVETVIKANEQVKQRMVKKIFSVLDNSTENKIISFLGVTFKPNTDDIRDAPSLSILPQLQTDTTEIRVVDPKGFKEGKKFLKGINWFECPYESSLGADLIVILTEWNQFRALDLDRLSQAMRTPKIVDLRNIYSKEKAILSGFEVYECIGKYEN